MTTSRDEMLLKEQFSVTGRSNFDNSKRFSNLNLNAKHACFDNAFSTVQSCSKLKSNKNIGFTFTDSSHDKEKSWNKTTLSLKPLKHFNLIEEDDEEKVVRKRRWMNNKDSTNKKNSSTLSLHIAAYENFIETSNGKSENLQEKIEIEDKPKKTKAFKRIGPFSKPQTHRDRFEFPRHMDGNKSFEPEVQQFSASQKLFTPNQGVLMSPTQFPPWFTLMLSALAATFMIIGGAIPYVPQYIDINRTKSAEGFSLHVCLALCVANILRILFWFGKRFDIVLLIQSIVMIICMILMLEISVRMGKKNVARTQRKSVWKGHLVSAFWKWNDLTSYLGVLAGFTAVASVITAIFTQFSYYVEALGMVALLCEACLALPQLLRNFRRRSTEGMSIKMVLMWLMGDVGKTLYFVIKKNPAQFWICSSLQITIDILILGQVYFYGKQRQSVPTDIIDPPSVKNRKLST